MTNFKSFPSKPGIYYFKNKAGKIIYIGKALSLKHRVASYFQKTDHNRKTKIMVGQIFSADYILAESEFDALLLEAKLIKEHRPKYNILLKDDKRYLYIAISKEQCPRIFPVRKVELEQNLLDWFGPFPSGTEVRQVLKIIRKIFPYRTKCKVMCGKPCLDYQINLCPGTCFKPVADYKKTIHQIRQILAGKTNKLINNLQKKMTEASKNMQYEQAQKIKGQLSSLVYVTQGWRHIPMDRQENNFIGNKLRKILVRYQTIDPITINKIEGYDISNLGRDIIVGAMVSFTHGQPDKANYRKFKITLTTNDKNRKINMLKQNDSLSIKHILLRRLRHSEWIYPQLILLDGGKGQVSAAFEAMQSKKLFETAILGLAKKKEEIVIPKIDKGNISGWKVLKLPTSSPTLKLLQQVRDEAHRFAQNYYKVLHKRKMKI